MSRTSAGRVFPGYKQVELDRFIDRVVDTKGREPLVHHFIDNVGNRLDPMAVFELWFDLAMLEVEFDNWRTANQDAREMTRDIMQLTCGVVYE